MSAAATLLSRGGTAPRRREPLAAPRDRRPRHRAVFVSDVHLGTKSCQARALVTFLRSVDCASLYLVGDIVDLWALRRRWHWPAEHMAVVHAILEKARAGTRVVYVPGNHDEALRSFLGLDVGGIRIRPHAVHETADGRRLLVVHGDAFDAHVAIGWLYWAGSVAYDAALALNRWIDALRRRMGLPYWSLATYLKERMRNARRHVERFERFMAGEARAHGADGVVCGHIHQPNATVVDGVRYFNDGDWVEHCTALVEHADGRMALVRFPRAGVVRAAARDAATAP